MLGEANEKKTNMDDLEGLKIDPRYLYNLLMYLLHMGRLRQVCA